MIISIIKLTIMTLKALILLLALGANAAQRPSEISICDWYAEDLFGANTAANQQLLMTYILNTAILGNYTQPNVGIAVTGVAGISVFNGTTVDVITYFDAALYSTNDGTTPHGVAKNFLDDGGATPLMNSMASNGNMSSAQYKLITHVWQYFGVLLNCSLQGNDDFPAYEGRQSMYEVHKYMDVTAYEQGWFVDQLTLAAASIGFTAADTTIWFNTMTGLFSSRCSLPTAVGYQSPQLQAICISSDCPLAENSDCSLYGVATPPAVANATLAGNYTKGACMNATNTTAYTCSPAPTFTGDAGTMTRYIGAIMGAIALSGILILL